MYAYSVESYSCDPMDCSPLGSSIRGIFWQEHWLPFPPPGDLPNPGTEPVSPALAGRFFPAAPQSPFNWDLATCTPPLGTSILKNWCFWTVVLEKTLKCPLDSKEIQPVHPKGNQSWIFFERTDTETETPTLWLPDVKNWLIGKDLDAGKDWRQEEKGTTED